MEQPEPKPVPTSVIRNNLLLLLGAALLATAMAKPTDGGSPIMFGLGFLAQSGINLLLGFINLRHRPALYFLSAALVLLIGFGACAGMLTLVPMNFH